MELTTNEIKVINAYKKNDIVSDYGWNSSEAAAWVEGFHRSCNMNGKTFSGVMSSLSKKNLIWTNGESFGLTEDGIAVGYLLDDNNFDSIVSPAR